MAFLQSSNVVRLFILLFPLVVAAQAAPTVAKSLQEDNHITDKRVGTFSRLGNNANAFDEGFGRFSVVKRMDRMRRRPEMNSRGMNGDAFTGGFGDFYTMKRSPNSKGGEWTSESELTYLRTKLAETLSLLSAYQHQLDQ